MADLDVAHPGRGNKLGWHFIVLMSRQGKIRLSEFFSSYSEAEKRRIIRDIAGEVLPRAPKMCNIIEKGEYKFVYRRYASLYFVAGVPQGMNELIVLEQIHLFVEALDGYFNSVCELDLVFSLHKSLMILFEMFIGGMLCESNKREVLKSIVEAEELVEEMTKPGEDTAAQLDDGLSYQEQFQLGRKPGRRGHAAGAGSGGGGPR
uniref:AP complex mu/sigma subunit domain-containing protein n=1 Tax=Trieres chinensis TaxID=1514140 RepID=A0A7S1ZNB0_TRICV|mmetsp:Transcript_28939/g.59231  ORF Transcript_28939/g.59231 Transcript_28939/m.59231 type:complete len:205 (+) Transcript_28939:72-686(+)|eukprot:CAMPEP_0183309680 /NCGR_PEP_ID=MMETSP0160_2-20130417/25483_1 /TAXON_ID=2839 ORGANISM="Odontella Sinensis, Strain Grunow 1884" /NCGR_SAMPLE_ID=MMETSP0160_2 /ASSEMBLY_ACC=CAM_ASM_000250 /LENGTH=204 /DNA_ID=CAMNT_0025473741 /DNA_START=61 /DNA_END=675 /DNA_ORIENTATION=+